MKTTEIRLVKESDAADLLKIYGPYVEETNISFEYKVPSEKEFRSRIKEISRDYPFIVYLLEGKIIGYAYAHRHMERAAYQWNAELSVYIDKGHQRLGAGKQLYTILMELLKLQNVYNVYGCVKSPNENSERLHEYFGFRKIGIFHGTGYKCGEWHDIVWFEKAIGEKGGEPKPFVSIREIDTKEVI